MQTSGTLLIAQASCPQTENAKPHSLYNICCFSSFVVCFLLIRCLTYTSIAYLVTQFRSFFSFGRICLSRRSTVLNVKFLFLVFFDWNSLSTFYIVKLGIERIERKKFIFFSFNNIQWLCCITHFISFKFSFCRIIIFWNVDRCINGQ